MFAAFWGVFSGPAALAVGIVLALLGLGELGARGKSASKVLIQLSIVLLGFSISLAEVASAGVRGLALSTGAILLVFASAWGLCRVLKVEHKVAALLASGTAICGGSAIAATSGVIGASAAEAAVATAVVFILNACGVYAYPAIGHWLGLSDGQFGAWAAVGIHDVAGVVAAGAAFSREAAEQATVIKLTRVLWIVPVAIALAWWVRRMERAGVSDGLGGGGSRGGVAVGAAQASRPTTPVPWFILWFLGACAVRSFVPQVRLALPEVGDVVASVTGVSRWLLPSWLADLAGQDDQGRSLVTAAAVLRGLGKALLAVALLLIGLGLSRAVLCRVGARALVMGVLLWLIVSVAALFVVRVSVPGGGTSSVVGGNSGGAVGSGTAGGARGVAPASGERP